MAISKSFKFHGDVSSHFGVAILSFLLTVITLGLGYPWAVCMKEQWKANNTTINGKKLKFIGTGSGLFMKWLLWSFLFIITIGIYGLWIAPKFQKWVIEHTDFVDDLN
jgi:uncharacterized membrane protein YjgN (DUF898 family)